MNLPSESSRYPFFRLSIRSKMLVAFITLALGPMLVLGVFLFYGSENILGERIAQELQVEVVTAAETIEAHLAGVRRDVLSLARFLERRLEPKMSETQWQAVEEEFVKTIAAERAYYQVRFIGADGMETIRVNNEGGHLVLVPPQRLQFKGDRYYFREAMLSPPAEVYLSELDFNIEHGEMEEPRRLVVRLAAPVSDRTEQMRGIVVINVFGEEMLDTLEKLRPVPDVRALLMNEDGRFVEMRRDGEQTYFHAGMAGELEQQLAPALESDGTNRIISTEDYLVAAAPVHPGGGRTWRLAKIYPRRVFLSDLDRLHRIFVIFALPLVLLAAAAAVFAARSFSRPIGRLSLFSDKVAKGDYDQKIVVSSGDELGQLAVSLNAMTASLADSRARLLEWNRSLQTEVERQLKARQQSEAEAEQFRRTMMSLEKQLVAADRLASLGMLSATIAHEIGNPLAGLQARLQMLRRKSTDSSAQGDLDRLLDLTERLGLFLRQLTGYLGPDPQNDLASADLCQVLNDLAFILREDAERRGASLVLELPPHPIHVCSRAQYLHQIFMNLILNACQAVGEGGQIRVAASCAAGRVRVEVADNGPGLSEDADRLFEPLFTTKEQGTGLGLAIVRKLTEDLGGTVTLRNRPGGGAMAEVNLPERKDGCRIES